MDIEIIKEYLVSLGFQINNTEFNRMKQTLDNLTKKVEEHTSVMTAEYVKAGGAIVGVLTTITGALVTMIDKMAEADLDYQKFALHMYMNVEAAKKMKIATDALGESIKDIAWMPELRERYAKLLADQKAMHTPEDAKDQLRAIRDLRFEFVRLKVEANYAMQWITYKVSQALGLDTRKSWLANLNDTIQKNMPEWTDKLSRFFEIIIQLGGDAWRAIQFLYEKFESLWNILDEGQKHIAKIVAVMGTLMFTGVIGQLTTILLLMDDFFAYIDGRKSSSKLGPIWHALLNALDVIVRTTVAAMVLVEELHQKMDKNSGKSMKTIWKEVKDAWTHIPGYTPDKPEMEGQLPSDIYLKRNGQQPTGYFGAAASVSAKTGIPAGIIYGQWYHETGGFKSRLATEQNNLGGLKDKQGNYMSFGSVDEFANYYASYIPRKYGNEATSATSADQYALALKHGGYYEDSYNNYAAGIRRGMANYNQGINATYTTAGGMSGGNSSTNINVGPINVTQPNASAEDIGNIVVRRIDEKYGMSTQRNLLASGIQP